MGNWDGLNRRKFPRVKYPCLVVLEGDGGAKEVILAHTENIGVGGICVILKHDVKSFTGVGLEIDLLDMSENIQCQGKVVWNVQRKSDAKKKPLFFDIGIEFQGLPEKDYSRLEEIIKRLVEIHKESPY